MEIKNFKACFNQKLIFGKESINKLAEEVLNFGDNIFLVIGKTSLEKNGNLNKIIKILKDNKINYTIYNVCGEPSPEIIDEAKAIASKKNVHCIVSIGGGSVIDTGKAVSAMLCEKGSVIDYLEEIGTKKPSGIKAPFIAIPTTAGTGSEVTKNAVISRIGKNGFKKSLRHDNYIPDLAIIDPELMLNTPFEISLSTAMDALSQLIESLISKNSSILTDTLGYSALLEFRDGFLSLLEKKDCIEVRSKLAYAAYISGFCLANAGLAVIHSLAGIIGGLVNIPHGVCCGILFKPSIEELISNHNDNEEFKEKIIRITNILLNENNKEFNESSIKLINFLNKIYNKINFPSLKDFGIKFSDLEFIIKNSDNKSCLIKLNEKSIKNILEKSL